MGPRSLPQFFPFLHRASRAKVLIREICNSIIAQAVRYINGGDIFTMISSEETVECYAKLENTFEHLHSVQGTVSLGHVHRVRSWINEMS